jgi:predicted nucleic acid-binding protein
MPLPDFKGSTLYLDTMIPYALLRDIEPAATVLFERIRAGELHAYTSVLTFDELIYRSLLALVRERYPGSPLDHLRNRKAQMVAEFYPLLATALARLRDFPNLTWLEVTVADLTQMSENIGVYHILPRDALHLAAMQKCSCFDLVSHDADFDRVPSVRRYTLA